MPRHGVSEMASNVCFGSCITVTTTVFFYGMGMQRWRWFARRDSFPSVSKAEVAQHLYDTAEAVHLKKVSIASMSYRTARL